MSINYGVKKVEFQGDSRTAGIGASVWSNRWTYLHATESNGLEWNNGISGMHLQNVGNVNYFNETVISNKGSEFTKLWICFGSNDLIGNPANYTTAAFKTKLSQVVDYAVSTKGWLYSDIILPNVNYIAPTGYGTYGTIERHEAYNEVIRQVALEKGTIFIDIYTPFKALVNKDSLFVDGLHETDAGYRQVATMMNAMTFSVYTGPTGIKTFKGRKFIKTAVGQIPVDVPLFLTSLQAPPQPIIHELFDNNYAAPTDFYGAMFNPVTAYQDFPTGQNPVISHFELGAKSYIGVDTLIYGVNADNTEELIVTHTGLGTFNITPKSYKRIKYLVANNCRPVYIKVFGTYTPIVSPANPIYTKYKIGNHTGINGHPYNYLENLTNVNIRNTIYPSAMNVLNALGSTRIYIDNINITEVKDVFRYESDRQGYNVDALIQELYNANVYVVWCMQGGTPWLNAGYTNPTGNNERVPVYFGADRLNPASWADYADIAFQIAARYGSNPNVNPALVKSLEGPMWSGAQEPNVFHKRIGMNILKEIEPYNEIDKWWKGSESYATGKEMAVGMNVIYNKIKEADPNMLVTYPGLAAFSADILQDFTYWSMKLYSQIPVDNYAYHYYPNSAGSQYSGEVSTGKAIEISFAPTALNDFRRSNILRLGNKPFDCGEIGYDSSTNSPLRAVVPIGSGYTQREWAGILYSRVALYHAKNGVRRTFHYQWNDLNNDQYNQFAAMGFVYQSGAAWVAYPNFNMLSQIRSVAGDYIHSLELSSTPLIDKWVNGSAVIYSAYSATENNTSSNYDLLLPNGTQVQVIELSLNNTTPTVTNQTVSGGKIIVNCTEKPKFIKIL